MNIMLTGAGAPGVMGTFYALKNNPDKKEVKVVGIDLNPNAVGANIVDKFYVVPAPEAKNYLGIIIKICKDEKIDLILPQTTREISFYSQHQKALEFEGVKVLVASGNAIEIANNKLKTMNVFRNLDLPYPEFIHCNNLDSFNLAYDKLSSNGSSPVVMKAPVANGMRGLRIIKANPWNQERFLSEKPSGVELEKEDFIKMMGADQGWLDLVACEYLPGDEYSVDAFVGKKVTIVIPRKRIQIRSGISFVTGIDMSQTSMIEQTKVVASEIGLKGVFGFQYKIAEDGTPKVLECNPRVQGTMVASVLAGANVIWYAVKELLGETVTDNPEIEDGLIFRRYWGGIAQVNSKQVKL